MDRLGHSDENTTRKIYLHVTNQMIQKENSELAFNHIYCFSFSYI
ncbi:hypothetical protein [Lederbergia graminis]|uniref:Integrase n=1 Tax=Lederbergia graminis TaxID=735518 RepID=A0ABW0LHJ4_9BACI